jgi:hypothetical protein
LHQLSLPAGHVQQVTHSSQPPLHAQLLDNALVPVSQTLLDVPLSQQELQHAVQLQQDIQFHQLEQ